MVKYTHLNAEWTNLTSLLNVRVNPIQGSSAVVKVLLEKKNETGSLKWTILFVFITDLITIIFFTISITILCKNIII